MYRIPRCIHFNRFEVGKYPNDGRKRFTRKKRQANFGIDKV